MSEAKLLLYVGETDRLDDPLPASYLNASGVVVRTVGDVSYRCTRCHQPWQRHGWMAIPQDGAGMSVDCSERPRL